MSSGVLLDAAPDTSWRASLELRFARHGKKTALIKCLHKGPLRVQKALYPEGAEICHAVIIHPPGGIAGGDQLNFDIDLEENSRAVLSTPASTKWYKTPFRFSSQEIRISLERGASLDWLPQENLFFNASHARSKFSLVLAPGATALGWEVMMLGRRASDEKWEDGSIRFATEISRPSGEMLWRERTFFSADSPVLQAPQGLDGFNLSGLLWAVGPACTQEWAESLATDLPFTKELRAGVSCLPSGVLILRVLSQRIEPLRALLIDYWTKIRPAINGLSAQPLRLWAT